MNNYLNPELVQTVKRAVSALAYRRQLALMDESDIAQRIYIKLHKAASHFRLSHGLASDVELLFEHDREWTRYAMTVIRHECAESANAMSRQITERQRSISRDSCDIDTEDETAPLRFDRELLHHDIEDAISRMHGQNRAIIDAFYRRGLSLRELSRQMGISLSSFQSGPWRSATAEFKRLYSNP